KISDSLFHLREIEYEQNRIRNVGPWRQSRVASAVMDEMNGHRDSLQKLGGKLILREFDLQLDKLNNLTAQEKTIQFEITNAERGALEQELIHGKGGAGALAGKEKEAKII